MNEPPDKLRVVRLVKKKAKSPKGQRGPAEASVQGGERRPMGRPRMKKSPKRWAKKKGRRRGATQRKSARSAPPSAPVVLTEEDRAKILQLYQAMVLANERPPGGRRRKIATVLNLPYKQVAEVVKNFLTHARYRRTNFEIEKAYWRAVQAGETNARAIAAQIAGQLQLAEGRVWWWLKKLHEPRKSFARDPEIEESKREAILAEYRAYLQRTEPPVKGLHLTLAEHIGGLTPRQVHKVLWEYRIGIWNSLEGIDQPPTSDAAPSPESQ
ncbi:MAG: hypothetical protein D6723_08145 [Acidobacteria bacterium]|nr:MAG: hypothetical protein D6723_08145 [Acidobacteriota bacterium]